MTWGFSSYETRIRWAAALWAVLMTAWCMCPLVWYWRLAGAGIWLGITVLASLSFAWWRPRSDRNVPIFLSLDAVEDTPETGTDAKQILRVQDFKTLVYHLTAAGYRFQTVSEALTAPARKSIVFTFGAGTRALHHTLFPLLCELKVKATIFATAQGEADPHFLKPLELQEMERSGYVEIGGTLPTMAAEATDEAIAAELRSTRHWLAGVNSALPVAFAYPHHADVARLEPLVRAAGYKIAFTEGRRPQAITDENRFRVPRNPIPRGAKPWQAYLLATRGRYSLISPYKVKKLLSRH